MARPAFFLICLFFPSAFPPITPTTTPAASPAPAPFTNPIIPLVNLSPPNIFYESDSADMRAKSEYFISCPHYLALTEITEILKRLKRNFLETHLPYGLSTYFQASASPPFKRYLSDAVEPRLPSTSYIHPEVLVVSRSLCPSMLTIYSVLKIGSVRYSTAMPFSLHARTAAENAVSPS